MTPVIILLGIYSGIFTPTESAAVVVVYSAILGFMVYREVGVKELINVLKETVNESIGICILISAATLFGYTLNRAAIPQTIVASVMDKITSPFMFLIVLNLVLLVVGMFMETVASITILTPIIYPLAIAFGVNEIQLGVIIVLNLMIGVVSPPFGVVLFAITKVGRISFGRLVKAMLPWYAILLIALLLITFVPPLTTWLPSLMSLGG